MRHGLPVDGEEGRGGEGGGCAELCHWCLGLSPASFLLLPTLAHDKNKGSARRGQQPGQGGLQAYMPELKLG